MTITDPVDDPRPARRRRGTAAAKGGTIEEQISGAIERGLGGLTDSIARNFDTVLASNRAALKEVAEAKRDLQQTLDMVIRAKADALALAGGMGGMAPSAAKTPVAVAVQELDEAREIRRRAAQATDENYKKQERDARGRFVKKQQQVEEVQQQAEDRFDEADKRRDDAAKQRDEQQKARQEQLDRHDADTAENRVRVSEATTGRRRRLDYDIDLSQGPGGWQGLQQQTRQGIRESVYRAASRRAEQYLEPEGTFSDIATRQVERLRPGVTMDETGQYFDEQGQLISARDATQVLGDQGSYLRKAMLAQTGMRALNAWRGGAPIGRSLASALPGGLLKGVGIGSAIVGGANELWTRIQDQHEINRQFQEVYGGGNLEQFGPRLDRWLTTNIKGRFSMLGGGNYGALWDQAMQLGLRGGAQDEYIDEGAQIMRMGVGREQTREIMAVAVEAGQSLKGLSDAIKEVNASAKDAGINAARARDIFIKNYQASSDIMFGGVGSQRMATAITQAQVGMARQYQDVNFMPSYAADSMRGRLLASRLGVPYSEFLTANEQNPLIGMLASEEQIREMLRSIPSENPGETRNMEQVVVDFMRSIGGASNFNPQLDQRNLGMAIIDAGFTPDTIAMFLSSMGVQVASANDAPAIAGMYFTNLTPGQQGLQTEEETIRSLAPGTTFGTGTAGEWEAQQMAGATTTGGAPDDLMYSYLTGRNQRYARRTDESLNDLTPYQAAAGEERDLIVEQFISGNTQEELEVDAGTKLAIWIRNENGNRVRRVVDLGWALQYAPEQIATAQIVEGAAEEAIGQQVWEALGLPQEAVEQYGDRVERQVYGEAEEDWEGVSMAEWQRQNAPTEEEQAAAAEAAQNETRVVLDLTPRAQQLLQRVTSSSPYQTGNIDTGANVVDVVVGSGG